MRNRFAIAACMDPFSRLFRVTILAPPTVLQKCTHNVHTEGHYAEIEYGTSTSTSTSTVPASSAPERK